MKHCDANADWKLSNFGVALFRDEILKRIEHRSFVNNPSSSKSGSGQILIILSNKGSSLRSDMTSNGFCINSPSTNCRCFCSFASNFKRLIAALAISLGRVYRFLSSRETIVFWRFLFGLFKTTSLRAMPML